MDDFFRFSKKSGFWVFLVHPSVVSVLLSASVERCSVSRMRDFDVNLLNFLPKKSYAGMNMAFNFLAPRVGYFAHMDLKQK